MKNCVATIARWPGKWVRGPIIWFKNYSPGVKVENTDDGLFRFGIGTGDEVHAIMRSVGALSGVIRLKYEVTGSGFHPVERPDVVPLVSVMFQRRFDNWSGDGRYNFYRLYSVWTAKLEAGPIVETEISLDDPAAWISTKGKLAANNHMDAFEAAKRKASNLSIVFGQFNGRSHGATWDGDFRLLDFSTGAP